MPVTKKTIRTSHGVIAISETPGSGMPVLMLHGNSSCKEVFAGQLEGELGDRFHLVAMDLPGHGASSDAVDPQRSYSMSGYAAAAVEVLDGLAISKAAVFGWSLGGHVGIEMLPLFPGMLGLLIVGAPPVRQDMDSIMMGFQPSPELMLAGKEQFDEEDYQAFADLTVGGIDDPLLARAMRRTHGLARGTMFQSLMAGKASDERDLVENAAIPVAVINGEKDKLVNLDYIGGLRIRNLWNEHHYLLRGLGHASFREAPEIFNPILSSFLTDVEATQGRDYRRTRRNKTRAA
jgi:pimeloyl-ACP methyl ester carboxylesterase